MSDTESPRAMAPDDGITAPAPFKAGPAEKPAPAERRTFEDWASAKHGVMVDDRGRASGVIKGKLDRARGHAAALVNGARSKHRIPIGRTMTEAEFDSLLEAVASMRIQ